VEIAGRGAAGSLSPVELALIERVRSAFRARTAVDCTQCRYCLPCPQGIDIPLILSCVNNASLFDDLTAERASYQFELGAGHTASASDCTECGQCEEACPQQIPVSQELAKAAQLLG
jgi:predicted aldo/keto reductase-like oxidoreductase